MRSNLENEAAIVEVLDLQRIGSAREQVGVKVDVDGMNA
jgi:hypothetical protein